MFRVVNYVMAALFVASAILQYNDPDPLRWMAIYGAAALACFDLPPLRSRWVFPALVGLVALGWAAVWAPATIPGFELRDLVKTMHAGTPAIELNRELLGLLIVAAWMGVLVWVRTRPRS